MASYVDTQIAASRKTVGDAVAGKGLQKAIRQLQEKSKVRDSLKDLPARGAISAKRSVGKRAGNARTVFNEQSRSYHATTRQLRSTDGLFSLDYQNVAQIVFDGATFNYLDYDPDA